jgi:hypothetical protein
VPSSGERIHLCGIEEEFGDAAVAPPADRSSIAGWKARLPMLGGRRFTGFTRATSPHYRHKAAARRTPATPSWLIRCPFAATVSAIALSGLSLASQRDHVGNSFLFSFMRNELAVVAASEAKRNFAPEVAAPCLLVSLYLGNSLADAVAFGLGEGGGDRQEQF